MRARCAVLLIPLLAAFACNRSDSPAPAPPAVNAPPVSAPSPAAVPGRVGAIELGKAVGADGRVTAPTTSFAPADTIYVSVFTGDQAAGGTLTARWTYEDGQLVSEGRETIAGEGRAATEFHIAKPDGWPAGRYRVDLALNGEPAGSRDFEVR